MSKPEVEGDDSYVDVTFQVDESYRRVQLSGKEPDHASLTSYARTAIADGDFDDKFNELGVLLQKRLRSKKRKLRGSR